jgi:predicted metalloenzyme YecM
MFASLEEFYHAAEPHINEFDLFAEKHSLQGITASDHMCYKCATGDSFESIRRLFEDNSVYTYQAMISGRRIVYIRLTKPLITLLGPIHFLELSDQKPDGSQTERFDHIEVYPTDISYEDMVARLEQSERVLHTVRPHHTTHDVDISGGFLFRCTSEPLIEKIKREELI